MWPPIDKVCCSAPCSGPPGSTGNLLLPVPGMQALCSPARCNGGKFPDPGTQIASERTPFTCPINPPSPGGRGMGTRTPIAAVGVASCRTRRNSRQSRPRTPETRIGALGTLESLPALENGGRRRDAHPRCRRWSRASCRPRRRSPRSRPRTPRRSSCTSCSRCRCCSRPPAPN